MDMSEKTQTKINKLIDLYCEEIGAEKVNDREWRYLTRHGVRMRIKPYGSWVYMSFGYDDGDAGIKRMLPLLAGPNSDRRFNKFCGKYNLLFAHNCKPADAFSIFKADMSLFIRRKDINILDGSIELTAKKYLKKSAPDVSPHTAVMGKDVNEWAAKAIILLKKERGEDDMSWYEYMEIIRIAHALGVVNPAALGLD